MPVQLLQQLLGTLRDCLGIHAGAEVSLEADPGTFDVDKLARYAGCGVTRVSMGVQSFQQVGKWMGCGAGKKEQVPGHEG